MHFENLIFMGRKKVKVQFRVQLRRQFANDLGYLSVHFISKWENIWSCCVLQANEVVRGKTHGD